jgi:hypothetical protein
MWLNFGIITLALIVTVICIDETFYPRHLKPEEIPVPKSRVMRLIGVEQIRTNWTTNSIWEASARVGKTLIKLPVFLTCVFYFLDCEYSNFECSYY